MLKDIMIGVGVLGGLIVSLILVLKQNIGEGVRMTAKQNQRGHEMYYDEIKQEWLCSDNNSPIDVDRPCIKCNHLPTDLGHDYCLKELSNCEFITNACCGHGINDDAYILLKDGRRFVLDNRLRGDLE